MNNLLYIGLTVTLLIIAGLSIWSGTQAKKSTRNPASVVAGVIMGTLVGGSSTVGTAQLAFQFGMSAWWYTLGAGISCLILALVYTKPLRRTGCPTLVGIIRKEYGPKVGMSVSVLSSIGTFINVIPQVIAATAVLAVVFPTMGLTAEVILAVAFMILYVIFGGTKGAGIIGIVKMILIYLTMIISAVFSATGTSWMCLILRDPSFGATITEVYWVASESTFAALRITFSTWRERRSR